MATTVLEFVERVAEGLGTVEGLRLRVLGWIEASDSRTHWDLAMVLQAWHAGKPNGEYFALRQSLLAFMVFGDGVRLEDAAEALEISFSTAQRDLRTLERVFAVMRDQTAEIVVCDAG